MLAKIFGKKHEIEEREENGDIWHMTYYQLGNKIYVTEYHDWANDYHME